MVNDLQEQITAQADAIAQQTIPGAALPFVDSSFAPIFDRDFDPEGVAVTLRFGIPTDTRELHIILVYRHLAVSEATYGRKRKKCSLEHDIEDTHRAAGLITDSLNLVLPYSTVVDVIRLAVEPSGAANPTNTDFSGYPGNVLFTFTTPDRFGSPSSPTLADIFTDLDPTTPEYDAYALLTQHAPQDPVTGANLSYRAAGVDWCRAILTRDFGGSVGVVELPFDNFLSEADLDAVDGSGRGICKIKCTDLRPGGNYTHIRNTVHTLTGKKHSNASIPFRAAFQITDLSQLSNLAIGIVDTGENSEEHVQSSLKLTQPAATVVALKNVTQKMKRSAAAGYKRVPPPRNHDVQSDAYHQLNLNAGTVSLSIGSPTVVGVGTDFTKFEEGWEIKVGIQTLEIDSIASATSMTMTTNSIQNLGPGAAFTVVIVIPLALLKTKANQTYNVRLILRSRSGTSITIDRTFSTGADGKVINDTDVPSDLTAPFIDWTPSGRLRIRSMRAATNIATLKNKYLVLYDGTSNPVTTQYLELLSRSQILGTVNENLARFEFGLKSHTTLVDIKKKIYKDAFGASGDFKCYWYAENQQGISLPSADSNTLNVATMGSDIIADGSNGVGQVDVGAGMNTKVQIIQNGDFHFAESATILRHWKRRVSPFTAATDITTTTSEDIWWDQDDDWVVWENNASRLYGPLKKWVKGKEVITVTFMAKTAGTLVNPLVNIRVRLGDNTDVTVAAAPCTLTGINTTFQMFGGTIQVIDNPGTGNRFLSFETAHTLSDANAIHIDKVMVVRGKDPAAFAPRPSSYETGLVDEDPDTTPTATPASLPDLGTAAGVEGGFIAGAGFGGQFNVAQ